MSSAWSCTASARRKRRLRLRELGLEHIELLGRAGERRIVARHRGAGGGDPRGRLLRVLDAAVALGGELGIALVVLLGEGLVGLVDVDGRLGRGDRGLLGVERRLLVGDVGLGGRDIGLGLLERDLEVAVVDAGQDLARP